MPRKKRSGFGDLVIARDAFERGEGRCPQCRLPIGPADQPTFVKSFGTAPPTLATMRCGRCNAMLTLRFEETASS